MGFILGLCWHLEMSWLKMGGATRLESLLDSFLLMTTLNGILGPIYPSRGDAPMNGDLIWGKQFFFFCVFWEYERNIINKVYYKWNSMF